MPPGFVASPRIADQPPMWSAHELIVAPATVAGNGARAVVRLAGDGLEAVLERLFVPEVGDGFGRAGQPPRRVRARLSPAALGREWGGIGVEILHWPGPSGPTGGPLAELQLPCSPLLSAAVVEEACRLGCRLARGGEFSLRAFLAGRLDLLQAEAVVGVVDARTPAELTAALDRMAGGLGRQLRDVRESLLDLAADVEASIDFADERTPDAVPAGEAAAAGSLEGRIAAAVDALSQVAARLAARDAGVSGRLPRAVLVGRPNIGKSSLFNAVVGRDAAIVADASGTTRDWIAARLDDGGTACLVVDLAGLPDAPVPHDSPGPYRPAGHPVEAAAVAGAVDEIGRAEVVILCRDAGGSGGEDAALDHLLPAAATRIDVVTRCDLAPGRAEAAGGIATSSRAGIGIDALRRRIIAAVAARPAHAPTATLRMSVGIEAAKRSLEAARGILPAARSAGGEGDVDEAIVAGFLNRAIHDLGEVTGAEIGNDILDRLFSRHCIGK